MYENWKSEFLILQSAYALLSFTKKNDRFCCYSLEEKFLSKEKNYQYS